MYIALYFSLGLRPYRVDTPAPIGSLKLSDVEPSKVECVGGVNGNGCQLEIGEPSSS